MMEIRGWQGAGLMLAWLWSSMVTAAVRDVQVETRAPITLGQHQLEAVSGRLYFSWDPAHPANSAVVDLQRAPRDEHGLVRADANFFLIQPLDAAKRQGALLEVSNRGSKASLRYFNGADANEWPVNAADLGDGLLQDLGLSLLWVGWQPDVPAKPERMYAKLPRAEGIEGQARSDWTLYEPKTSLALVHRQGLETLYPVDPERESEAWLTHRLERDAVPRLVPRQKWRFDEEGKTIEGEFVPGIYELVYPSRDPVVAGLGLAIIRDTAQFLKSDGQEFQVPKVIGFGVSQTGRFLRHFLYQGFNKTEAGGKALDGMLIHTAGAGRGSFNHRFAQPSRDAHRMSAFFYPTDLFPFISAPVKSPLSGKPEGLLDQLPTELRPRIMVTNTGYEYWGRAAGLIHSHGDKDIAPEQEERIYHLASAQHFVERTANLVVGEDGITRGNPLDLLVHLRALLSRLADWTLRDMVPPPSQYPSFADGTLVSFDDYRLPAGVDAAIPRAPHTAYLVDYGAAWPRGEITNQPPGRLAVWVPPVPAVDQYGNERSGIRHPLLAAPLATFLPWHRQPDGWAADEMTDFRGSLVPLSHQETMNYSQDKSSYLEAIEKALNQSINRGWVLPRDRNRVMNQADWLWQWRFGGQDKKVNKQ